MKKMEIAQGVAQSDQIKEKLLELRKLVNEKIESAYPYPSVYKGLLSTLDLYIDSDFARDDL